MPSRGRYSVPSVRASSISGPFSERWRISATTGTPPSSRTVYPERVHLWPTSPRASRPYARRRDRSEFPPPTDSRRTQMPRINIRYDSSLVDGAELATLMIELAEMGARQYFTTPEKVVVELFEQSLHTLGHRTLDVEINALPDPEGRRAGQIESFALEMVDFLADWLHKQGVDGTVGAE